MIFEKKYVSLLLSTKKIHRLHFSEAKRPHFHEFNRPHFTSLKPTSLSLPYLSYFMMSHSTLLFTRYAASNYSSSVLLFSSSRFFILLRLIINVDALCKSADTVGWTIPVTPSRISPELIPTIFL